jgi:hypothetical protein
MNKKLKQQIMSKFNKLDESYFIKLMIETWNDDAPHFNGMGPHRYDDRSKECSYCLRPKNWKKVNAGMAVIELSEDTE